MAKKPVKIVIEMTDEDLILDVQGDHETLHKMLGAAFISSEEFRDLVGSTLSSVIAYELKQQGIDIMDMINQAMNRHAHNPFDPFAAKKKEKEKVVN